MYLQEILEVAVGLVFMWLVLSIAAMTIQEWIGNVVNWRANDLYRAIRNMLGDDALTNQVYEHPVIANLYPQPKPGRKPKYPSYMPAEKFALALFDVITRAGVHSSPMQKMIDELDGELKKHLQGEQLTVAQQDLKAIQEAAGRIASSVSSLDSLRTQVDALAVKIPELKKVIEGWWPQVNGFYTRFLSEYGSVMDAQPGLREFYFSLQALEATNAKLTASLSTFLRNARVTAGQGGQTLVQARSGVESWFNDAMDRLSGSYKRRSQFIAFLVGFVLALILNVDSVNVATSLWREPTLRQAIVAQAQAYADQNQTAPGATANPARAISDLQQELTALQIPFGWNTATFDTEGKQCALIPSKPDQVWGIPSRDENGAASCKRIYNFPADLWDWVTMLIGFLITGAATAQGAPFWFDILKKIINVRGSGVKPNEKQPAG